MDVGISLSLSLVLEDEPMRALARAPRGLAEEEEEAAGSGQEVAPVIRSRIAITE